MPLSVSEGYETFLSRLIPLESQRKTAAKHRSSIESSLSNALDVFLFRETGSFTHGTGVRNYCDSDLLVSLKGSRPGSSDTAIRWVREALQASFPYTPVRVSRPAIVVPFAGGAETWEIIPGFITAGGGERHSVYNIPGASSGWLESAPTAHLEYVNKANSKKGATGGAKKLARLMKAWKYYNNVPMSSFYLEMRAAKHMTTQDSFIPIWDVCLLLESMNSLQLAAMNDPTDISGRFYACSSDSGKAEALSKVHTAATRARKALDAYRDDKPGLAFYYLDLLYSGKFPAR
ncbi:nucleotidyltransferase [Actinomadura bangladeshensis]|uniref:Nucleotidyltransferase n=2 Tax=Actinomadura bangladeshensis TaxID=453573 RepID=A0A6L9QGY2_9ACTN|nr:nucleotidyltransferase [Actinomadura bangladeshensis]NEA24729.1 nucleotidyltransferase [Actinomadura bangladeshensis]